MNILILPLSFLYVDQGLAVADKPGSVPVGVDLVSLLLRHLINILNDETAPPVPAHRPADALGFLRQGGER
jgi:hypothetical protein